MVILIISIINIIYIFKDGSLLICKSIVIISFIEVTEEDKIALDTAADDENKIKQKEHSCNRVIFSIIVWIEYLSLIGTILFFWTIDDVPYDLDLSIFLPIMSLIFLIGQILEWKYHISYPFSEIQDNYNKKKKLVYGVIGVLSLGALITVLIFTFHSNFAKTFVAFLGISFISLVTLFIITIANGIQKLFFCFSTKEIIPPNDQSSKGDEKCNERQKVKHEESIEANIAEPYLKSGKFRFSSFQKKF